MRVESIDEPNKNGDVRVYSRQEVCRVTIIQSRCPTLIWGYISQVYEHNRYASGTQEVQHGVYNPVRCGSLQRKRKTKHAMEGEKTHENTWARRPIRSSIQPFNQPINESTNQPINHPINQSISQPINAVPPQTRGGCADNITVLVCSSDLVHLPPHKHTIRRGSLAICYRIHLDTRVRHSPPSPSPTSSSSSSSSAIEP